MIQDGDVELGGRLMPEREIAQKFGVSRSTVREALDEMKVHGEIETRRGRGGGNFVLSSGARWETFDRMSVISGSHRILKHHAGTPQSISATLAQQGFDTKTKLHQAQIKQCDESVTSIFGYAASADLTVIERTRFANEIPISFECAYLDPRLFPDFLKSNYMPSVYKVIQEEFGIFIAHVNERVEVVPATDVIGHHLGVTSGEPLLLIRSWASDEKDRVVQYSHDFFRADRVALMVANDYRRDSS
jgi:GntR family transcriptional regulator